MQFFPFLKKSGLIMLLFLLMVTPAWAAGEGFTLRSIPLSIVYGGTVVLVIVSIRIGFSLGKARHKLLGLQIDPTITPVSGALMGLLAFILAFTFNLSMGRFDMRRTLYLDQVDAIEMLFRRAKLLPERYREVI